MLSARIIGTALWIALALLALVYVTPGSAGEARLHSAPHLSQIVRTLTRPGATVYCGYRVAGNAGEARKDLNRVYLEQSVCTALKIAPKVIEPEYPRSDSGEAVFTLAHEAGHLVTPGGEMAESQADCYATRNWRRYARALRYSAQDTARLAVQIKRATAGCWH